MSAASFRSERGFVLVMVLVTLMLLVVLGVSTTTQTSIELQIAGNDKVAKQTFYTAESAVYHAAQLIENASSTSLEQRSSLDSASFAPTSSMTARPYRMSDLLSLSTGPSSLFPDTDGDGSLSDAEIVAALTAMTNGGVQTGAPYSFVIIDRGIATGASQRMEGSSGSRLHEYTLYGRAVVSNAGAATTKKIGYKRRF